MMQSKLYNNMSKQSFNFLVMKLKALLTTRVLKLEQHAVQNYSVGPTSEIDSYVGGGEETVNRSKKDVPISYASVAAQD